MINLEKIRLGFRGWMSTAGMDLDMLVPENYSDSTAELQDVLIEELLESTMETTNTPADTILRGIATYVVAAKKGKGTDAAGDVLYDLKTVFDPDTRKDQTIDTDIRVQLEEVVQGRGSSQGKRAKRWRIPLFVTFRAYRNN